MKLKLKNFFQILAICTLCGIIFIGFGYFYLKNAFAKENVQNEAEKVPYYSYSPESKGILLDIGGTKTLYYLDFFNKELCVIFVENNADFDDIYGYSVDFTVETDYDLVSGVVDNIGGIDLEIDGEILLATGKQVVDYLTTSADFNNKKKEIIEKLFTKISQVGFSKNDFLYIIENSETNLTIPDCYLWSDYIAEICQNIRIIN